MVISLSPEIEQMVQRQLASGLYASASEVVQEALRLLEQRNPLDELSRFVAVGIEQADRGELTEGTVAFDAIRERIRQKAGQM